MSWIKVTLFTAIHEDSFDVVMYQLTTSNISYCLCIKLRSDLSDVGMHVTLCCALQCYYCKLHPNIPSHHKCIASYHHVW